MTRLLGVIGDPISHSLSPVIHNGWLRAAGVDATYEAMQVREGELGGALKTLTSRSVYGVNITLPHKGAALALSDTASEAAMAVGAANTLTWQSGAWHADNTDIPGVVRALDLAGYGALDGSSVLLLGAGGAARAVAFALAGAGSRVTVLNRTVEKAASLARSLSGPDSAYGSIDQLADFLDDTDIVINTLSLGHTGQYLALVEGRGRLFYDISYGAAAAGQLSEAANAGWKTQDGLSMLVAQAAESFKIWFDITPDFDGALKRCRALVEATS
ncbi:MAG: shikimate dehydrogenase [Pseudomonadota bacterium]